MVTAIDLTSLQCPSEPSKLLAQLFKSYPDIVRFSKKKIYPIKLPDPNQPGKTIEYELKLSNPILVRNSIKSPGKKRYEVLNEKLLHRDWQIPSITKLSKYLGIGSYAKVTPIIATLKVVDDDTVITRRKKRVAKKITIRPGKRKADKNAIQNEYELLERALDPHAKKPVFNSPPSADGESRKESAYIVMDEAEGITLFELVNSNKIKSFSSEQIIEMLISIATAVHTRIHQAKIIHRDLKLENIFFDSESGKSTVVDCGLAKKSEIPGIGFTGGTPGFSPPEQYTGTKTDTWSDVFALGKTFEKIFENALLSDEHTEPLVSVIKSMIKRKREKRITLPECIKRLIFILLDAKKIVQSIDKNYPTPAKTAVKLDIIKYQLARAVRNYLVQPTNSFLLLFSKNDTTETYRNTSERRLKNCFEILEIINKSNQADKLLTDVRSYTENKIQIGIETFDLGWGFGSELQDLLLNTINDHKTDCATNKRNLTVPRSP